MFALTTLLADTGLHSPSGWTDKEVLLYVVGAVGSTLFVMVPIAWAVVKMLSSGARRQAAKLEAENKSLRTALKKSENPPEDEAEKLEEAANRVAHLEAKL